MTDQATNATGAGGSPLERGVRAPCQKCGSPVLCEQSGCADAAMVREALGRLLAACEEANAAAIEKLGGIVVDHAPLADARRALDGSISFCGGWQNILLGMVRQPALKWDAEECSGRPNVVLTERAK